MTEAVWTKNLSFTYAEGESPALEDVTLSIRQGECVVLCGQSGCGKSTLLRLINGLIPEVHPGTFRGQGGIFHLPMGQSTVTDLVPLVGSVFQNPKTQHFNLNTTAELAFPCENAGWESERIRRQVATVSQKLHLENLLGRSIFPLSGGEKQRLAFGSGCMLSPRILVLDEPTSNLDEPSMAALHDLLVEMKGQGVTLVIAEHRLSWLGDVADRFLYLEKGRLLQQWSARELGEKEPGFLESLGLRPFRMESYMRLIEETRGLAGEEALLSAKNLTIGYGKKALRTVPHLTLCRGEILCLMGPNGCGKTTLAHTLCGVNGEVGGEVLDPSTDLVLKKRQRLSRAFLVMQDVNYQLFSDSVEGEVMLGCKQPQQVEQVLKLLGLEELRRRHPMSLSGGQRQRLAIACALVCGKEWIVLDEPTSGLDYYHMTKVGELLHLLKKQGVAVLVITHDRELAALWSDRMIQWEEI